VPKAIADTGPVRHLHEIRQQASLSVFDELLMPELVADELRTYGVEPSVLGVNALTVTIVPIAKLTWEAVINELNQPIIHPADAQVFVLAQTHHFQEPVLTDDLALRRRLENSGATVIGSVGILVRAYHTKHLNRAELDKAIDALFTISTLHMSRAFRAYVRQLLADLS
jgi:predicted nucleic acid-binding protein